MKKQQPVLEQQDLFAKPKSEEPEDPKNTYLKLPYGSQEREDVWRTIVPKCLLCNESTNVKITDGQQWSAPCCGRQACAEKIRNDHQESKNKTE